MCQKEVCAARRPAIVRRSSRPEGDDGERVDPFGVPPPPPRFWGYAIRWEIEGEVCLSPLECYFPYLRIHISMLPSRFNDLDKERNRSDDARPNVSQLCLHVAEQLSVM